MAKIGTFQLQAFEGTIIEKQNKLLEYSEKCLIDGADLVLMPEAYQYTSHRDIIEKKNQLRKMNIEWMERCKELALKYHAYVVPWDYWVEGKHVFNSSYIIGRSGEFVGRYDKCNLTYPEHERGIEPGNSYPVFDLDIGKVGIMICFDNYFPEAAAALAIKGAELVLYPLFGDRLKPQWELKFRTRALDHCMCIVSNQIGMRDTAYSGAVDQYGNVVERLTGVDTYKVISLDLKHKVLTNTYSNEMGEDIREYLHKLRNYKSYSCLAEEGYRSLEWEDIFCERNYDVSNNGK